jgi:hypothetical protein
MGLWWEIEAQSSRERRIPRLRVPELELAASDEENREWQGKDRRRRWGDEEPNPILIRRARVSTASYARRDVFSGDDREDAGWGEVRRGGVQRAGGFRGGWMFSSMLCTYAVFALLFSLFQGILRVGVRVTQMIKVAFF